MIVIKDIKKYYKELILLILLTVIVVKGLNPKNYIEAIEFTYIGVVDLNDSRTRILLYILDFLFYLYLISRSLEYEFNKCYPFKIIRYDKKKFWLRDIIFRINKIVILFKLIQFIILLCIYKFLFFKIQSEAIIYKVSLKRIFIMISTQTIMLFVVLQLMIILIIITKNLNIALTVQVIMCVSNIAMNTIFINKLSIFNNASYILHNSNFKYIFSYKYLVVIWLILIILNTRLIESRER